MTLMRASRCLVIPNRGLSSSLSPPRCPPTSHPPITSTPPAVACHPHLKTLTSPHPRPQRKSPWQEQPPSLVKTHKPIPTPPQPVPPKGSSTRCKNSKPWSCCTSPPFRRPPAILKGSSSLPPLYPALIPCPRGKGESVLGGGEVGGVALMKIGEVWRGLLGALLRERT